MNPSNVLPSPVLVTDQQGVTLSVNFLIMLVADRRRVEAWKCWGPAA